MQLYHFTNIFEYNFIILTYPNAIIPFTNIFEYNFTIIRMQFTILQIYSNVIKS